MVIHKNTFLKTVTVKGGQSKYVRLFSASDLLATLPKENTDQIYIKYHVPQSIKAPIIKGQKIGRIDAYVGSRKAGSIYLTSKVGIPTVPKRSFMKYFGVILENWLRVS